jgi:predicted nucleotide-binding protein
VTTVEEIVKGIDELQKELDDLVKRIRRNPSEAAPLNAKLNRWSTRAHTKLADWGLPQDANLLSGAQYDHLGYDPPGNLFRQAQAKYQILNALKEDMAAHPDDYRSKLYPRAQLEPVGKESAATKAPKLFLGHGRSKPWARVHMHIRDDLKLEVEAWETESRAGLHSIEVLKGLLASCTFAVIVATGEDATHGGEVRARQNVVHEIGLFQGRLGFEKVALLRQEGIEEFSNLAGLQVIPFAGDQIEAAFYDLGRMLKREGIVK